MNLIHYLYLIAFLYSIGFTTSFECLEKYDVNEIDNGIEIRGSSSENIQTNAFSVLMGRKCIYTEEKVPKTGGKLNGKDENFNDIVKSFEGNKIDFSKEVASSGSKYVLVIYNV